jgi:hypothetical protein
MSQPHVLVLPGQALTEAAPAALGPYTKRGNTANFDVYFDNSLGINGQGLADAVLSSCEQDFAQLRNWFGGINAGRFAVYIDPGTFGAYHANCAATELHCAAFSGTNGALVNMLNVAEVDEVFMAVQNAGWNCGASNGEGLSRVLATDRYPAQLNGFASGANWLASNRPDWVSNTEPTDRNYVSIGCATLFINYLRFELGFNLNQIVQAGGMTLAEVFTRLTASLDAFSLFALELAQRFPPGHPSGLTNDNPYPIARVLGKNILVDTALQSIAATDFAGRVHISWCGTDSQHHLNAMSSDRRLVWSQKAVLGDTAVTGVCLTVFNNRLFIAWSGVGNRQLNVMSSADGINWSGKVTLGETSGARPALAVHNRQLVLGWTGTDAHKHLNLLFSSDGQHWGGKRTLGETAIDSLALASFQGRLYIGWAGTDSAHHVNVAFTIDGGATQGGKVTLGETSPVAPSLLVFGNELILAWTGTDSGHHLNLLRSNDGAHFGGKATLGETSAYTPTLGVCYGRPAICWTGTDSSHRLNLMSI